MKGFTSVTKKNLQTTDTKEQHSHKKVMKLKLLGMSEEKVERISTKTTWKFSQVLIIPMCFLLFI